MATRDTEILSRIGELVDRERALRDRHEQSPLDENELLQLEDAGAQLDQCWDLLNQRRALLEFGMDPGRPGFATRTPLRGTSSNPS